MKDSLNSQNGAQPMMLRAYNKKTISTGKSSQPKLIQNAEQSLKRKKLSTDEVLSDKTNIMSGHWSKDEDCNLTKAVAINNGKNWKKIAEVLPGRTDVQCLHRWQKVLNPELVKGPWSEEEDNLVIKLVEMYGPQKWTFIAEHLPGRIGKQCRERWQHQVNPNILHR